MLKLRPLRNKLASGTSLRARFLVWHPILIFLISQVLCETSAFGKDFIIASLGDPLDIYPLKQKAGEDLVIRNLLNPPILEIRSDGRISCIICKEVPDIELIKENDTNEVQSVINLELKKKLKWGDGTPITPQDVKFTLETMALADYPRGQSPILPIRRIEFDKEQKNKLRLILTQRRSDAFQLFAISLLPSQKADLIKKLQSEPKDANWWAKLQDPGLYYGPYIVKSAGKERWLLTSNKNSTWDNAPNESLEIRHFTKLSAIAKALSSREIDQTAIGELSWLDFLELKSLTPNLEDSFTLQSRPGTTLELLLLNMRSPLLVNPQMRQILYHAIERNRIVRDVLKSQGYAAHALLHPKQLERMGEKSPDPYQVQLVAQLLEQSGARKGPDGTLLMDGQKISLVLSCSDTRLKSGIYQSLVEDLIRVGIEVKIDSLPEDEFIKQVLGHRRFKDMACMRWRLPPLSAPIGLMHSLAIPNSENNYSGSNFSGWDQPIVDRILESMLHEGDLSQMHRLFSRLDKQFLSELPAIPLVYLPDLWLDRKDLGNKELEQSQLRLSSFPATPETLPRRKM